MKLYGKYKCIITTILIISLLCSPSSLLITEATYGNYNSVGTYNCYAYAINEIILDEAFYYHPYSNKQNYQPGDISEYNYNNFDCDFEGYDLNRIKCNTIKDLYALGYTGVMIYNNIEDEIAYNTMLANVVSSNKELICFRVGSDDYHFMRYDSATNAWYNKLGDGPIYKYTDNNGIPSNDIPWDESGKNYNSEIIYLAYNKLQINISETGEFNGIVTVKGGDNYTPSNNYVFCCGYDECCNPNGVCLCDGELMGGGKDAVYEIVIPESGYYNISMQLGGSIGFYCTIYSYNMYNGDYAILSSATDSTGYSTSMFFQASENTENRYYLKVHFNKLNPYDMNISINVTHLHDYTNHYDEYSSTQHTAYCWCGDEILETHSILNGECSKCGEPHTHSYLYHHIRMNNRLHRSYCCCGEYTLNAHVIYREDLISGNGTATCMICNGSATDGLVIASVNNLPHTDNGSYIMQSGVIVLVDEDIEAYFDGTLVFIYPDNNLETE